MNNPLHDDRLCFSAAASPSLAAKSSYSLSLRLTGSFLSLTFNQRSLKLVLHGEGRVCKPIVCGLARTRYSSQVRHRKQARRKFVQKRIKSQKEAAREAMLSKLDPIQPSEDCLVRLYEEQPLRLQNSNATFQCISQESDIVMQKTPRLVRNGDSISTTSSIEVSCVDGSFHVKPDFTTRLLEILSGAKEEAERDDIKSTAHIDSQLYEENFENIVMQRAQQSQVFTGSQIQSKLATDVEKEAKLFGETNECSGGDIPESPLIKGDILQGDHLAAEETDFKSAFSDDSCYSDSDNGQGILGHVTSGYSNGHFKISKATQSESFPSPPNSKAQTFLSPRHLSRSSGSRSSPSRSSIPGLRSKYSKPDPKAKLLSKLAKPLRLLPNFEVMTEQTSISPLGGDDAISSTLSDVPEGKERESENQIDFDWWESDQDEEFNNDCPTGGKSANGRAVRDPPKLQLDSEVITKSYNSPHSKATGTSRNFQQFGNQSVRKSKERIDLKWSDSDEDKELRAEDSLLFDSSDSDEERSLGEENSPLFEWTDSDEETSQRVEDSQLFEWSDSDAGPALEEERSNRRQCDLDARDRNDSENGLLSASTQHLLSSERKPLSSLSKGECGSKCTSWPHTWYSRKECNESGSFTYNDGKSFIEDNQSLAHNESHQLPASVKFLDVPLWKRQIFPHTSFRFEYSYSEIPKAPILGFRDHFSPFGPQTLQRPWTGRPLVKPRRPLKADQPFDPELERIKSFEFSFNRKWKPPKRVKSREEVLGPPLTDDEVTVLVQNCHAEKRQVNLGRDGLTHNMLHLIHTHWKRHSVCRIKCRGPPTLDMDNLCFHIEDKTGGQIIYRTGCLLYLFRGRYYNYRRRPLLPYMLYRPSSPVYPKLVPRAPAGLTIEEAKQLRSLGQKVKPLIKLGKNGAFPNLVRLVRDAFIVDDLVSIDYEGLKAGDYRKIGAKLKELVPCVLLSFKNNRIVLWRGRDSSPSLSGSSKVHIETGGLATELSLDGMDAEGSSVTASEFRSTDIGIEAVTGKAGDIGTQIEEAASALSQKSEKGNIQLHPPGNMETMCRESVTPASDLEGHMQTGAEPSSAATDVAGKAGDIGTQIEEASALSQESEGNVQLHPPGNMETMCRESVIKSSVFRRHMLTGAEPSSAATDVAGKAGDIVLQIEDLSAEFEEGNIQLHAPGNMETMCRESVIRSSDLERHMQTGTEPSNSAIDVAGKAGDIGTQIEPAAASALSQESEGNIQLHLPRNMETICRESVIKSSILKRHMQTGAVPSSSATDVAGKAGDIVTQIEEASALSQESEEGNIQLHPPGNVETMCRESVIWSSDLERHMQTGAEPSNAATGVIAQEDVIGASCIYGNLDALWDTALKEGVAVELEGVDLEADYVLQLASVFAEVAPVEPKYTNQLLNQLRLQGLYKKRPKRFVVHLQVRRETVPRRKRPQKQASNPPKVKRHPDMGLPLDALSRILDQK